MTLRRSTNRLVAALARARDVVVDMRKYRSDCGQVIARKGYPEYDDKQQRGEDGKWVDEGGSSAGRAKSPPTSTGRGRKPREAKPPKGPKSVFFPGVKTEGIPSRTINLPNWDYVPRVTEDWGPSGLPEKKPRQRRLKV